MHKTIKGVTEDMERMTFNTAISKMMEMVNAIYKSDNPIAKADMESFVKLLSPLAPFISEELWERLGHTESITYAPWPTHDETLLVKNDMNIVIQVLGKKRATLTVPVDITQDDLLALAKNESHVQEFIAGKEIIKVIYVPGRLMNIVVK